MHDSADAGRERRRKAKPPRPLPAVSTTGGRLQRGPAGAINLDHILFAAKAMKKRDYYAAGA